MRLTKIIDREVIVSAIRNISSKIPKDENIFFLGILNGCTDFLHYLKKDHKEVSVCKIKSSSYNGLKRGELHHEVLFDLNILKGKKVYIVDDIIDSGHTLNSVTDMIREYTNDISWCCLFKKEGSPESERLVEGYLVIPRNYFIVGFGMDYYDKYRELEDLYIVRED